MSRLLLAWWSLLLLGTVRGQSEARETLNGKVGGSVTFTASHSKQASEITWKISSDIYAEVYKTGDPTYYRHPERSRVDFESGTLTITDLLVSDSGDYTAEILIGTQIIPRSFTLQVWPEVSKPIVNCTKHNDGNFTLFCNYSSSVVGYKWKNIETCTQATCKIPDYRELVTCIVSNPVSKNESDATCPKPEEPDGVYRTHLAVWLTLGLLVVVIIGIVLGCLYNNRERRNEPGQSTNDQETSPLNKKRNESAQSTNVKTVDETTNEKNQGNTILNEKRNESAPSTNVKTLNETTNEKNQGNTVLNEKRNESAPSTNVKTLNESTNEKNQGNTVLNDEKNKKNEETTGNTSL